MTRVKRAQTEDTEEPEATVQTAIVVRVASLKEEEDAPHPEVWESFEQYDQYTGWESDIHVQIPEVNPWNMENDLSLAERMKHSKGLFDGAAHELKVLIPQALKDRAQRDASKALVVQAKGITRKADKILEAALGFGLATSCLYHMVRPALTKPGEALSEKSTAVLKYQVMGGDTDVMEVEEKEFLYLHPEYQVPDRGEPEYHPRLVPKAEDVVQEQIAHYAPFIDNDVVVTQVNVNAQHFLLSLEALLDVDRGSPEMRAFVFGVLNHHMDGKEGSFNGRDSLAMFEEINNGGGKKKRQKGRTRMNSGRAKQKK